MIRAWTRSPNISASAAGACGRNASVMFQTMDGADHTLSAAWARRRLKQAITRYLRERFSIDIAADTAGDDGARPDPSGRSLQPDAIRLGRQILVDPAPTAV